MCDDCLRMTVGRCWKHSKRWWHLTTDKPIQIVEAAHQHHYIPYPDRPSLLIVRKIYCDGCGDVKSL